MKSEADPLPVLLFDGECGLCHAVVRLLLRTDKTGRLHFAPLQGEAAQAYLYEQGLPTKDFDSLVFVPDWNDPLASPPLFRTDGALAAASVVGGVWRMVAWLRILPVGLRDFAYRLVARSRYALFGVYRPTPWPDPGWAERFLDQGREKYQSPQAPEGLPRAVEGNGPYLSSVQKQKDDGIIPSD